MDAEFENTSVREQALVDAFVVLADTLVSDFDVIEFFDRLLETCVQTLGADGAGLLLHDRTSGLRVVASSSEHTNFVELLELQQHDGPCTDAFETSLAVAEGDLRSGAPWPVFAPAARRAGFTAVVALPLRLRSESIGALNLFYEQPRSPVPADILAAQALADVATIGLLQHRAAVRADTLAAQLQVALESRSHIEQVKGLLAERGGLTAGAAFELFRRFCRERRMPVSETARRVMAREIDPDDVLAARWPPDPRSV